MNATNAAVTQRDNNSAAQTSAQSRAVESVIRAPVDIYEDGEGIVLEADMPGVSKDRLTVRVDGETLVLEGNVRFDLPEHAEALHADVRATVYRRNFVLGRELDSEKIHAQLKDGVLRVNIPKRAELRPRRIEVQGG
jgi:HSP20 family protein